MTLLPLHLVVNWPVFTILLTVCLKVATDLSPVHTSDNVAKNGDIVAGVEGALDNTMQSNGDKTICGRLAKIDVRALRMFAFIPLYTDTMYA